MRSKSVVLWVVIGAVGLLACGCSLSLPGSRTCDQGCSDPVQATSKILGNDVGGLNPDDVQVLTDLAMQVSGVAFPEVTNEQAAAVVSFLQANGITTLQSLQAKIAQAEADPSSIVIPDDVLAVLQQIAANPDAYINAVQQL